MKFIVKAHHFLLFGLGFLSLSLSLYFLSQREPAADAAIFYKLIPEFEPVESVVVSDILFNENFKGLALAEAIVASKAQLLIASNQVLTEKERLSWLKEKGLDRLAANQFEIVTISHDTQWIRDYGPLAMRMQQAATGPRLGLIDLRYKNEMRLDDSVPYQLALYFNSDIHHIPLNFDGGNFLTDGERCYMTAAVRKELNLSSKEFATNKTGAEELIKRYFKQEMGCKDVVLFENVPHEHIDMWAKIVNKDTVFVNEISAATLQDALDKNGFVPKDLVDLRDTLDTLATEFSRYLKVERVPMPAPFRNVLRTYANALLVNNNALIPRYRQFGWQGERYPDDNLHARYEKEVQTRYEKYGYTVRFVDADGLIFNGGALHCVAQQIPQVSTRL